MTQISIQQQQQQEIEESNSETTNTQEIRQKISLSTAQLREISKDDVKFFNTIYQTNNKAIEKINNKAVKEALIYLNQAEKILQYGACYGKVIERNLIINTLHNQAVAYQRLWALDKCSKYIEAVIYNIESSLENQQNLYMKINFNQSNLNSKQLELISSVIKKKIFLVEYYLQYCAIMSQSKLHESSLNASMKSLHLIKQVLQVCYQYYKINMFKQKEGMEITGRKLKILKEISIKEQIETLNYETLLNRVKKILKQSKIVKQRQREQDAQTIEWIKTFAIGNIMQIQPKKYEDFEKVFNFSAEFTIKAIFYKIILVTVSYFTIATQLRLLQFQKKCNQQQKTKQNNHTNYEIYHLKALQVICSYVPYQSHFINHILNSYKNHYKTDLFSQRIYQESVQQKKIQKQQILNNEQKIIENEHKEVLELPQMIEHEYNDNQMIKVSQNQIISTPIILNRSRQLQDKKQKIKNKKQKQTSKTKIKTQFHKNTPIHNQKIIKNSNKKPKILATILRQLSKEHSKSKSKSKENHIKKSIERSNQIMKRQQFFSPKFDHTKNFFKSSKVKSKGLSVTQRSQSKKIKTKINQQIKETKIQNEYQLKKKKTIKQKKK